MENWGQLKIKNVKLKNGDVAYRDELVPNECLRMAELYFAQKDDTHVVGAAHTGTEKADAHLHVAEASLLHDLYDLNGIRA